MFVIQLPRCSQFQDAKYDTEQAAVVAASEVCKELDVFYVGELVEPTAPEDLWTADDWLEDVSCDDDYCGDHADGWDESTDEQRKELDVEVRSVLAAWLDRHKLRPTFRNIENIVAYIVRDGIARLAGEREPLITVDGRAWSYDATFDDQEILVDLGEDRSVDRWRVDMSREITRNERRLWEVPIRFMRHERWINNCTDAEVALLFRLSGKRNQWLIHEDPDSNRIWTFVADSMTVRFSRIGTSEANTDWPFSPLVLDAEREIEIVDVPGAYCRIPVKTVQPATRPQPEWLEDGTEAEFRTLDRYLKAKRP